MAITPDTKNWTWVLERPCPDCGFEAATVDPTTTGDVVRAFLPEWSAVLARPDVRERPSPDVWSPLEYACHVRDVCRVMDTRLALMLAVDDPMFPNWDQDATAADDRYGEQDPGLVDDELRSAGTAIAARFDTVTADQWDRPGSRSDGSGFTVASLARYFLHDPIHHLWDVGRQP